MSEAFDQAWDETGKAEGGYSNHPSDPGGETMWGITARVARAQGYSGEMRDLPRDLARSIAKREYWDRLSLDAIAELSVPIAREIFDTNFNFWYGAAAKFLQRALNGFNRQERDYDDLDVDGALGSQTVEALEAFLLRRSAEDGEMVMLAALNAQQGADYLRQASENPQKEDFLFGWFRHRVTNLGAES